MTTLSFIMATRNAEQFLAEALASTTIALVGIAADIEILVADGDSSDATLEIASAHPKTRIVSRADRGIYDGMNKAIAAAGGDYCLILNGDDMLMPAALGKAMALLAASPNAGFASSPALFGTCTGNAVLKVHSRPLTPEGAMFGIPAINARLFRRRLLQNAGPIRADIGLAADREFLARLARSGGNGVAIDDPLYFYRIHGGSHTISGDTSGRARVYDAEIRLADALADHEDVELRRLANASGAVATLKRGILDRRWRSRVGSSSLPDLARGLLLSQKWRGRLSGH